MCLVLARLLLGLKDGICRVRGLDEEICKLDDTSETMGMKAYPAWRSGCRVARRRIWQMEYRHDRLKEAQERENQRWTSSVS